MIRTHESGHSDSEFSPHDLNDSSLNEKPQLTDAYALTLPCRLQSITKHRQAGLVHQPAALREMCSDEVTVITALKDNLL